MYTSEYSEEAFSPQDIAQSRGLVVLEFGTNWCPICRAAQPAIQEVLSELKDALHIKVEDGPGRKLGRFFRVKLWPTLIFLRDGQEVARVVRPRDAAAISEALAAANVS